MEKIEVNRKRKVHLLARQPLWHGAKLWGRVLLLGHDHIQVPGIVLLFCKTKKELESSISKLQKTWGSFIYSSE